MQSASISHLISTTSPPCALWPALFRTIASLLAAGARIQSLSSPAAAADGRIAPCSSRSAQLWTDNEQQLCCLPRALRGGVQDERREAAACHEIRALDESAESANECMARLSDCSIHIICRHTRRWQARLHESHRTLVDDLHYCYNVLVTAHKTERERERRRWERGFIMEYSQRKDQSLGSEGHDGGTYIARERACMTIPHRKSKCSSAYMALD